MWGVAMDLGEWLKGLGLGQYEETFHEHEIDADVLPDLTEADLEKIGLPLGARKRLMKGIAGLASKEAPPSAEAPAPAAGNFSQGPPSADGLGRAPPDHCDVLRSRRVDQHFGRGSTPRIGAIWSTPTSTRRRRR